MTKGRNANEWRSKFYSYMFFILFNSIESIDGYNYTEHEQIIRLLSSASEESLLSPISLGAAKLRLFVIIRITMNMRQMNFMIFAILI
jgi:hypothetical protein